MKEEEGVVFSLEEIHPLDQGRSVETVSRDSEEEVGIRWCRGTRAMKGV